MEKNHTAARDARISRVELPYSKQANALLEAASCISLKQSPYARIHLINRRSWLLHAHCENPL
jgi:hypothetical protein